MEESLGALRHAAGFLRSRLAHTLTSRTVPELQFVYDESVERGIRLSRLIDEANQPAAGSDPDPT
jgi:ribosome-binding factor A